MLEQKKSGSIESTDITKDKEKLQTVLNTLEKARLYHEKYLLRSNSSDLENAVHYYIQAIKLNPQIPETYYRLASLMFENGQISLDSAIEQCKIAVDIAPDNPNAHLYTGYFLKLAHDFEEAEKEFRDAIKINPINSARPRLILASMLYEKINNVKPSFVDFIRMVYYACSGCLTVLWDLPSLRMMYKNVTDDALVFIYKTYGGFLEKIKNSTLAVATYDSAAINTGRDEYFYNKIGDICIKEHAPEIALDAYRKVLESNPYDRDALVKMATLVQTHFPQEYDEAIGEILVWLERKNEFTTLADNLIMKDGKLYYYGVEMRSTIAKKIEKDYADGTLDDRYVKFLVRLLRNPSAKSVNMLYDFMQANDIQIAEDGRIICYKGVQFNGDKWVDWHSGKVPQYQGAFVSMPRNFVEDDPEAACSYGLHCASKEYAKSYGTVMTVMVDPADVVSVPYQHNSAKCRACRYEIVVAPESRKDGDPIEYVVDRDGNTIDIIYEEA